MRHLLLACLLAASLAFRDESHRQETLELYRQARAVYLERLGR